MDWFYVDIEGTPFGINVVKSIDNGYRWFLALGHDNDNEYVIEDEQTYETTEQAIAAAYDQLSLTVAEWSDRIEESRKKMNQW